MSYCALIQFKGGKPAGMVQFRNAWGGSARIWDAMFKAYIPQKHAHDTWLTASDDRRLWDLALRSDIPKSERAVHCFTFDRFFVCREHFAQIASDLRAFAQKYPTNLRADHLTAWAYWIEANTEAEAVSVYGTSCGDNPWTECGHCPTCGHVTDETLSVSLDKGTEVYRWLNERCDGGAS